MLNLLFDVLLPFSNKVIVSTVEGLFDNLRNDYDDTIYLSDGRSAAFYSFGISKKTNKPAILLVKSSDVPSIYTALSEVYYQATPLYVVVLSDASDYSYLDYCTWKKIEIKSNECIERLNEVIVTDSEKWYGPIILEIPYQCKKNDLIEVDLEVFDKCCNEIGNIFVSNMEYKNGNVNDKKIKICKETYGVLSKFIGFTYLLDSINVLYCTSKDLALDINIFNCRYISKRILIIVYEITGYEYDFSEWIESNGFGYICTETLEDESVTKAINSNSPYLIYVKNNC